jgi:hypothetical protein
MVSHPPESAAGNTITRELRLELLVVHKEKKDGYKYIDTASLPKLGYVSPAPDFQSPCECSLVKDEGSRLQLKAKLTGVSRLYENVPLLTQ